MKVDIFNQYVEAITKRYAISEQDFFSDTKKNEVVDSRYMLYYLCINRPMKHKDVQHFMSTKGKPVTHSTIIHGVRKIQEYLKDDRDMSEVLHKINQEACVQ
jgi:chromosomal replication initiation ATPase DnaA|tara:strand:+ start:1469 stop:1774 length:306 start_codon:yes stop_codon:yes gene_type:complete